MITLVYLLSQKKTYLFCKIKKKCHKKYQNFNKMNKREVKLGRRTKINRAKETIKVKINLKM